jgi:hypothetical protein
MREMYSVERGVFICNMTAKYWARKQCHQRSCKKITQATVTKHKKLVEGVSHKLRRGDFLSSPDIKKHTDCCGTLRFNQRGMTFSSGHKKLKLRQMLWLGMTLKSWSGKTAYKNYCDDNGSALKTVAIDDYDSIWVLLTSVMEWHEPTQCPPQLLGRENLFLYLLDVTTLKRLIQLSTVEVL